MKKRGSRFFQPDSIAELSEIIIKERDITLMAGGTSLLRENNGISLTLPGAIVILDKIPELKKENRTERYFEFGSMVTIDNIVSSSKKNLPQILLTGLDTLAPYPVRNVATIGGALADKVIISDIIPLLLIFDCKVEVMTFNGNKRRSKWESITQYLSTNRNRDLHLITRIRIPLSSPAYSQYYKTGQSFNLFSEITFAAVAELEKSNLTSLSMAFNIENRIIVKTKEIEERLVGKRVHSYYKNRDSLIDAITGSLSSYDGLKEYHKYQMAQIILHFLESF